MLKSGFPASIVCCPICHGDLSIGPDVCTCSLCAIEFPRVRELPVLIDFSHSVIDRDKLFVSSGDFAVKRLAPWRARLFGKMMGVDRSAVSSVQRILTRMHSLPYRPMVLVVGGGTIGNGMGPLYHDPMVDLVAFDVYASANIHLIADGHALPFQSGTFDAVIIQAVLEHVLDPPQVVDQLYRVLRSGGLVYVGTPFMQQIHEGPFDFTRYTESGHRWLFRKFTCLASGSEGGPGQALVWAIQYFVSGLFRSRKAGRLAQIMFFWLRFGDRIIPEPWRIDGACGVYFFGAKSAEELNPQEIIDYYQGAQR